MYTDGGPKWWVTKDGDKTCLAFYEKHYSAYQYRDGRRRTQFIGPGEKWPLRTAEGDALFVWRRFIDDSGQRGINCAVFRNESPYRSSDLIREADRIADCIWPHQRHYTYVNPEKVRSTNPGFCFIMAGWRRCGFTKGGLMVLEKPPVPETTSDFCRTAAERLCAESDKGTRSLIPKGNAIWMASVLRELFSEMRVTVATEQ